MKWPTELTLIRHAESTYNRHRLEIGNNEVYRDFLGAFEEDWHSAITKKLAVKVAVMLSKNNGEDSTAITAEGRECAREMGKKLADEIALPDTVYLSPFLRTRETWAQMQIGWPDLKKCRVLVDERIREQDFGLRLLYGDWRVMQVMHPEQRPLFNLQGEYWYRQPQGENIADVRARNRSWISALTRDQRSQRVLAITHHITILAFRANIERMDPDQFMQMRRNEVPANCSLTRYVGKSNSDGDEWLELDYFNKLLD